MGIAIDGPEISKMEWLGLLSDNQLPEGPTAPVDILTAHMLDKISYSEGERDMLETVQSSQSSLENLVSKVPGYQGYKEKELRREADKLLRLLDALEDLDDVQKVHSNADIDEAALADA